MSNIVELKTRSNKANQSCVETLESWLDMAKKGEINQVAISGLSPDHSSYTQYSDIEEVQTMLGAIEILKHKLLVSAVE